MKKLFTIILFLSVHLGYSQFTYDTMYVSNPKASFVSGDTVKITFHSTDAIHAYPFRIIVYNNLHGSDSQSYYWDTNINQMGNPSPNYYTFYFVVKDTTRNTDYHVRTYQHNYTVDDPNDLHQAVFNVTGNITEIIDQMQDNNVTGLYEFYDLNGRLIAKYWGDNPRETHLSGLYIYNFTAQNGRINRGKLLLE